MVGFAFLFCFFSGIQINVQRFHVRHNVNRESHVSEHELRIKCCLFNKRSTLSSR